MSLQRNAKKNFRFSRRSAKGSYFWGERKRGGKRKGGKRSKILLAHRELVSRYAQGYVLRVTDGRRTKSFSGKFIQLR